METILSVLSIVKGADIVNAEISKDGWEAILSILSIVKGADTVNDQKMGGRQYRQYCQ